MSLLLDVAGTLMRSCGVDTGFQDAVGDEGAEADNEWVMDLI
jgi:hypothetical protein